MAMVAMAAKNAQSVSHQDHIQAGLILQIGGGVIVASQPGDRLVIGDFIEQIGQGNFFALGHSVSPWSRMV